MKKVWKDRLFIFIELQTDKAACFFWERGMWRVGNFFDDISWWAWDKTYPKMPPNYVEDFE